MPSSCVSTALLWPSAICGSGALFTRGPKGVGGEQVPQLSCWSLCVAARLPGAGAACQAQGRQGFSIQKARAQQPCFCLVSSWLRISHNLSRCFLEVQGIIWRGRKSRPALWVVLERGTHWDLCWDSSSCSKCFSWVESGGAPIQMLFVPAQVPCSLLMLMVVAGPEATVGGPVWAGDAGGGRWRCRRSEVVQSCRSWFESMSSCSEHKLWNPTPLMSLCHTVQGTPEASGSWDLQK